MQVLNIAVTVGPEMPAEIPKTLNFTLTSDEKLTKDKPLAVVSDRASAPGSEASSYG